MKLRLFPNFCTFSALRSIALFSTGIAGRGGLATLLIGTDCEPCQSGKSLGLDGVLSLNGRSVGLGCACFLLSFLDGKGENPAAGLVSFPTAVFCRFSICPSTVVPLNAMSSSGMRLNRITPLAGATPSESARKLCSKAALRLFVVGSNWEGNALMVTR